MALIMNRTDLPLRRMQAPRHWLWQPKSVLPRPGTVLLMGLSLVLLLELTGCAQVQVHSVSPSAQEPSFELRAPSVERAQAEAARLCPAGYVVLRQAVRDTRTAPELFAVRWWDKATGWFDDDERQAQLAVACKVSTAP
jgi:hypothetical protein